MPTLHPTLILAGGRIWTGDASRLFAEAVAVHGDRIAAVDSNDEIRSMAGPETRVVELEGRLVTPGFIDNHLHFTTGGFHLARVNLRDAASPEELARRLGEWARRVPEGSWILGGEWDHEIWSPVRLPDRGTIDARTPDHPVFVWRLDIHMALANSRALALANIGRDTPDPEGGTIVRDETGEPTGILKDAAMDLVRAVIPPPSPEERVGAARAALDHARRFGVTAVCDMSWGDAYDDFRAYQTLEREGALMTRIDLFVPIATWRRLAEAGVERSFGTPRLRIGGLKGFADGSLGSATAWMHEPYDDMPDGRGLRMAAMEDGSMTEAVLGAAEHGLHVAIHAIGDRANDEVLDLFASVPDLRARRFRIEHAQHLREGTERRFAELGVVAAMQPYHLIDDGRWAERRIGTVRARRAWPFRSLLDAGATVTFGSDWPVAPLSPIRGIHAAVTRRTIDGRHPEGWMPEQKVALEEALRAYTTAAAWATFRERETGAIAPGLRADLAVLSRDLFAMEPEEIETATIDATILDGVVTFAR